MATDSWKGQILGGRYKLEEMLGQGGMSAVYKAFDPNLKRPVAIKLIHSHLSNNEEFVRRFEEEAAAVAQLRHPNIIQVFDFNHESGLYYMVLEYVAGETLQGRMKRMSDAGQHMPVGEVVKYAANVCDAAEYAHKRQMIHRDIKPANIMLDVHDQAILMDFGIAKIIGSQQHTATGAVIGTALYMSPEQIRGERVDHRSDIYSIGVLLFELVNGRPPFEGDSAITLMMKHLNDPVPDLRQLQPGVPEDLARIIEKSLAKSPELRYQTAAEMAADLRALQARLRGQPDATQFPATAAVAAAGQAPGKTNQMAESVTRRATGSMTGPASAAMTGPGTGAMSGPAAAGMTGSGTLPRQPGGTGPQAAVGSQGPSRRLLVSGGCAVALAIVALLIVSAVFAGRQYLVGRRSAAVAVAVSQTAASIASQTATATNTSQPAATATATQAPTDTPLPTDTPPSPTPQPVNTEPVVGQPTDASPTESPFRALITAIRLDEDGNYIVSYETIGFLENMNARHVHFYFNTVMEGEGDPGMENAVVMHGGPRPFTGLTEFDAPPTATVMCIIVALPDHSHVPGSGNCMPLPNRTPLVGGGPTPTTGKERDREKDTPDY